MTRLRALCVAIGLWLARRGGWTPCTRPHLPADASLADVQAIVADIAQRFAEAPGEFKRREALRVLLNVRPQTAIRDLNLLIELALQ